MKFLLGVTVGSVAPWVAAVVLHRLTQRRLPVRTDFLQHTTR